MKKNRLLVGIGVAVGVGFVVLASWWFTAKEPATHGQGLQKLTIVTPTHQQLELTVEVVQDPQRITKGLSGRREIGSDGMVFVFPFPGEYQFWMKEMLFPIDIIWIYQNQVIGVSSELPFPSPGVSTQHLPRYSPPAPIDMALEVPAGWSSQAAIVVGSTVELHNSLGFDELE